MHIAVDIMAKDIMAADIMATDIMAADIMAADIMAADIMATAAITARRRLQRLLVHPVGRRPSSRSRRIGRPATPTGMSAS